MPATPWRRDNPDKIGFIRGPLLHSPATRPGVTKGRILIVDDDESTRRFLAALLTALGHEVACAESGEEALHRLREPKGLLNKLKKWKVEPASKE